MSSTLDEFERINQLSANLTKYSTKEQVEFHLPFMCWALCFTRLMVKVIHGVNLDDIKDDKYRVFYLLDKYDLWDKYIGG